jgi:hypothetical protein
MQWRLFLLLALVFVVAPRLGMAEGVRGFGPITPISPLSGEHVSLFRSPAPRIKPQSASPTQPGATAMPVALRPALLLSVGAVCRAALIAAEMRHGIPAGLLQAIGIVESGRRDAATGAREPWPWTINAEGEPHLFSTKEQAVSWVRQAQARGTRSIDAGCAQVNLMHHPAAFASLEEAFDPAANADYAARFLKRLRDTAAAGNWMRAVGYYHSQTPELAETYRQQVRVAMSRSGEPIRGEPKAFASAPDRVPSSGLSGRGLPTAGTLSAPARLLVVPADTVGRGLAAYRATPVQMAHIVVPSPVILRR